MSDEIAISVIIVSYNTANIITKTIDSVLAQKNIQFELIIVDNCSPDNSVDVLRKYRERATLILNSVNLGSGQGANQGFRVAQGKWLYLLNPDAVLQSEHALYDICEFMNNHPRCGLAGTRLLENGGSVDVLPRKTYPYQQHTDSNYEQLPGNIAWVLGASMVLKRDVFLLTGGFSKDYFLYGDEVDLCLRVRKQGYEIGHIANVVVMHLGGGSEHNTKAYDYWIKKQQGLHMFIKTHYKPGDWIRILKLEKTRASWRRQFLKVKNRLLGLSDLQKEKLDRYNAIYDSAKRSLLEANGE